MTTKPSTVYIVYVQFTHMYVCFDACLCRITCIVVADYVLVELKIPLGDRPPSKEIDQMRAEGLKELVDLMENCWDENPSKRPTFKGGHL